MEKRDYRFDNLKTLLIFLVVIGHIYGEYRNDNILLNYLYSIIYIFHMPLFIFISGYFSKNVNKASQKANKLIMPYLIFNILWYIVLKFNNNINTPIYYWLLVPCGVMWYIFALFIWRKALPYLVKIKYILPISFIFSIIGGFIPHQQFLSIGRIIGFLPFFLLGYFTNEKHINKIRDMRKFICTILFISGIIISTIFTKSNIDAGNYSLSMSYLDLGVGIKGILFRILFFITAIIMSISIINLISNSENKLSYIGQVTMPIYLIHNFIRIFIVKIIPSWGINIFYDSIILLSPFLITLLLSNKYIVHIYNKIFS